METSILNQWFSGHEVGAICWTLIHSLWIGLIIALLCGIVIGSTRKSAAALRYRLLCSLLILFVFAIGITYFLETSSAPASHVAGQTQNIFVKAAANNVINPVTVPQNQTVLGKVQAFLNQNVNIIFMIWLLFFVLKSLKMVSGLLYIQRIRNYKTHVVTEELKHKIEQLSSQMGIRRAVRLVQSELVKVPVAIGWLKPMILLPLGIVLQLTPEQLEGILWHELAHIHRRDYLVNILQGLVETVFFFNPGLLWLSSLIRTEREACCDDMVLSRMNRKANYLEALLSFGYGEFKQAGLAMSIGSGNQLRDRLKRMISQENKRLSIAEKSVLAVGLLLLTAFTTISKDNPIIKHLTIKYTNKSGKVVTKTMGIWMHQLPAGQRVNDNSTGVRLKDTIVLTDTSIRFTSVLFKHSDADWANNDISAKDSRGNIYHFIVADGKIASMELNGAKIDESKLPDYEYILQSVISQLMEKRRVRDGDIARYKANLPYAKLLAERLPGRSYDDKHRDIDSMGSAYLKVMNDIIAGLVVHNVVNKAADVKWFALTDDKFIVNGQRQPDELQQTYKTKYGVHEGLGLYYGPVPMKGKGVFIDPEGMIKDRRLFDSIQSARFKARLETDDDRRTFKLQMMRQRLSDDSGNYKEQRQRALNVIADLVADKVVPNAASVQWFGLSNTEFIVNGQRQPDEMQQRYKAKYGIYEGNGLYYGPVQMHGTGVFIDATTSNERMQRLPVQPKAPRGPDYKGSLKPRYTDSVEWKNQQLIRQQQLFAASENKKRQQIIKDQQQLIKQQQLFAAKQDENRRHIIKQQQHLLASQQGRFNKWDNWDKRWNNSTESKIALPEVVSKITDELVNANVVNDKSDLIKFNLTNSALMVNGKKQSGELHERLKAKYLQDPNYPLTPGITSNSNFGIHFNSQNGAIGIGITDGPDSP